MTFVKRFVLWMAVFYFLLLIPFYSGSPSAQEITPAQELEWAEAKAAIDTARKAQAEKYALEPFQQAKNLLDAADSARQSKDGVKFGQASRLARAYAELAKTISELKSEEEKLAATQEELQKARAEFDRLKKSP